MQRPRRHEKHLSLRNSELGVRITAGENRHQHLTPQAIPDLVGVRVPMRFAEATLVDNQTIQGEASEDRENILCCRDLRAKGI